MPGFAVAYLSVPALIYLAAFSPWYFAVPLIGIAVVYVAIRAKRFRIDPAPNFVPLFLVALCAVWLSGALPPFAQNSDWVKHYAILNTLAGQPWPPILEWQGTEYSLRYALGWYTIPALVGKVVGYTAMQVAVLIWSALGLTLAFSLAFREKAVLAALIFLVFSGADILGTWATGIQQGPLLHLEWWSGFGNLPSNLTSVFWTPQHAIPAWIAAFLFLHHLQFAIRHGALIGVSVALWSPLAVIGLLPFAIIAVLPRYREALTVENFAVAVFAGIPALIFLTSGSADIPVEPLWTHPHVTLTNAVLFVGLEFWLMCVAIIVAKPRAWPLVTLCAGVLLALTMTRVGMFNDLLMRGSLPALGVLAMLAAKVCVSDKTPWRKGPVIALLVIGLATPMGEIMRGLTAPRIDGASLGLADAIQGMDYLAPQYLVPVGR